MPMPSPSPTRIHQEISKRLELLLIASIERPGRGWVYDAPLDVALFPDTVYQPDLLVVFSEHADRLRDTHIDGAPDIVIEALSPSTAKLDLVDKRYDYARAGVLEYWIVDPETRTVELYVPEGDVFRLRRAARQEGSVASEQIPELQVSLGELFSDL